MTSLREYAKSYLDLELPEEQIGQFDRLTEVLLEWNQGMNLTAITDPLQIAVKHYLDALTLTRVIPQFDHLNLIDVGTGAGFPGLALAIVYPLLRVTLMDSTGKKLRFIEKVRRNARTEEYPHASRSRGGRRQAEKAS